MLSFINAFLAATFVFGHTLNSVVRQPGNPKEGIAPYSIDLIAGWRSKTNADPYFFVTASGEKLRAYDFIDKKGDTLSVMCIKNPSLSLRQSAQVLLTLKPRNSSITIVRRQIGRFQSGLIIIRNRHSAKTGVSADLENKSDYISMIAEYVTYPTASQLASFEKMAASVKLLNR